MSDAVAGRKPLTSEPEEAREQERDRAWIAAAQQGDSSALESLLMAHEARVLRVIRLLGVAPDDREDLAQEVFVRLFRHLGGFRRGRPFAPWLYRIVVNVVHDHRRTVIRRSSHEAGWEEGLDPATPEAGPGDRLDLADRRRRLDSALTELTERERAVFVLSESEGLTPREIGRSLAISAITVRRHLGRARDRLRRVLAGD